MGVGECQASLMELCQLKKSELEPKFQKYRGTVVQRKGCVTRRQVQDDSGPNN